MQEFDIIYKQEDISDNCKTINEPITVTITLGEYRMLVEEKMRLGLENGTLFQQLCKANRKIEELEQNAR